MLSCTETTRTVSLKEFARASFKTFIQNDIKIRNCIRLVIVSDNIMQISSSQCLTRLAVIREALYISWCSKILLSIRIHQSDMLMDNRVSLFFLGSYLVMKNSSQQDCDNWYTDLSSDITLKSIGYTEKKWKIFYFKQDSLYFITFFNYLLKSEIALCNIPVT